MKKLIVRCLCVMLGFHLVCIWWFSSVSIRLPHALQDVTPISDESRETLFWYLCTSKDWQVRFESKSHAERYLRASKDWQTGYPPMTGTNNIYQSALDDVSSDSLSIRFTPPCPYINRVSFSHASIANEKLKLPLNRLGWSLRDMFDGGREFFTTLVYMLIGGEYQFTSYLELDLGNAIWLDVEECRNRRSRKDTKSVLKYASSIIRLASQGKETLYPMLVADGSIKIIDSNQDSICITDVEVDEYFISGYVNVSEPGLISLTAYELQTNIKLPVVYEDEVKVFIGWSADPNEHFYFKMRQISTEGDGSHKNARLDLTFIPTNGVPATLLSTNCMIRTRRGR